MKTSLKTYLETRNVYPESVDIAEASDFAQNKATEYLHSIDPDADVTVEDGVVYAKSDKIDEEFLSIAQSCFNEAFGAKMDELGYTEC